MSLTLTQRIKSLQPSLQKPTAPKVEKGQTEVTVPYLTPRTQEELIGHIPNDHFRSRQGVDGLLDSFRTVNADRPVYVSQPVIGEDGKPVFDQTSKVLDLTPASKVNYGIGGGLMGGFAGGAIGFGVAAVAGLALGPVIAAAAVVGLAAGAVLGAKSVEGDQTSIDFEKRDVERHRFNGYTESRHDTHGTENGKQGVTGTNFSYHAKISGHQVDGAYFWEPVVKHTKAW